MPNIVTLTTDFGTKDYYAGAFKGAILTQKPQVNLVDITHDVPDYDIVKAAFILKNCYHTFPKETIHVLYVHNRQAKNELLLIAKIDDYYFITPDNGVLFLIFPTLKLSSVFTFDYIKEKGAFAEKTHIAYIIAQIFNETELDKIGAPAKKIKESVLLSPVVSRQQIRGTVIHIDKFDNVITNITKKDFESVCENKSFELYFRRHNPLTKICKHYNEVPEGEVLCLFNDADLLEISINMGKAASLLNLKVDETVQIVFDELK